MTKREALEGFLTQKKGRFFLVFSRLMAIYRMTGYILMLILLFVLLQVKISGQVIIICLADTVAVASCVLLIRNTFRLTAQTNGREVSFLETMRRIHLSEVLRLMFTPFMSMAFCVLMRMLDGSIKTAAPYNYEMFRAAWEIFGISVMVCTGVRIAVCCTLEKHIGNKEGHDWLFLLLAVTGCLSASILIALMILFRPELSSGVLLRICLCPLPLYYILTAVYSVLYWLFLRDQKKQAAAKDFDDESDESKEKP